MNATKVDQAARSRLPRHFQIWLAGMLVSELGDTALYFALGWAASGHGGQAAGLVLSAIVLPRTVLLMTGGVLGDRLGARRIMITGDAIMLIVAAVLAAATWGRSVPLGLLLATGLIMGTVDAFYLPSSGSMPRQLVDDSQLSRAVALRQSGVQLISILGGPAGGVLVAFAGFAAACATDSATFAAVLVALILIRPRFPAQPAERTNILRESWDGVRVAVRTPGLGAALLLVAGVAGFVIPVGTLLVPLLARQHHWTAASAGLIVGAQAAGTIAATMLVARRGTYRRPGLAAAGGLLLIAPGLTALALTDTRLVALAAGVLTGVGIGTTVANLSPLLLGTAPRTHLARIQALLSLVQSGAVLVTNNLLGTIAHVTSASGALLCCAAMVVACAVFGLLAPAIRGLGLAREQAA